MSIGRRLYNMARSELNALLDRAVQAEREQDQDHDPDEDLYRRFSLDELSDAELEAEIDRRHRARTAGTRSATSGSEAKRSPSDGPTGAGRTGPTGSTRPRAQATDEELRRAYAALEVPFGSDFATVRRSYRALMRKYHPDRHAGAPDKLKTATELTQKLTLAYKLIQRRK